jgi:hypothetical protein
VIAKSTAIKDRGGKSGGRAANAIERADLMISRLRSDASIEGIV